MMTAFQTGFPDLKVEIIKDVVVKDNAAYIYWQATGTNTGQFMDNPPINKKVDVKGIQRLVC